MKNIRIPFLLIIFLLTFNFVKGQHYLNTTNYTQNFNTLGITGNVNELSTLPEGWSYKQFGPLANIYYGADNGTESFAYVFSYGQTGSTERALGSISNNQRQVKYGVTFINTTGKTITALSISFTSEVWRSGSFNRNDTTLFHYQLRNSLWSENNWVNVPQLNLISYPTTASYQLSGNDPMNQKNYLFVLENISIPVNDTFAFRWTDVDIVSGSDDGVAIDDFSLIAHTEDIFSPHISNLNPSTGSSVNGTFNGNIQFSEAVKKGTGNIRILKHPGSEEVQSIDINDPSVVISGQQVSFSVTGLVKEQDYQLLIDSGAIKDMVDNSFSGLKAGQWVFAVASDTDAQRPLIDTLFPKNAISTNYVSFHLYFKEPVKKGKGKVYVKTSNNQTVIEYSIDSSAVKISENQLSFKSNYLSIGGYYVTIDSGAVKDMANNNFNGISKVWSLSFGSG